MSYLNGPPETHAASIILIVHQRAARRWRWWRARTCRTCGCTWVCPQAATATRYLNLRKALDGKDPG